MQTDASNCGVNLSQTDKDLTLYLHMYQNVCCNISVYWNGFHISVCNSMNILCAFLCLVPVKRRRKVLSRKVYHFVIAFM